MHSKLTFHFIHSYIYSTHTVIISSSLIHTCTRSPSFPSSYSSSFPSSSIPLVHGTHTLHSFALGLHVHTHTITYTTFIQTYTFSLTFFFNLSLSGITNTHVHCSFSRTHTIFFFLPSASLSITPYTHLTSSHPFSIHAILLFIHYPSPLLTPYTHKPSHSPLFSDMKNRATMFLSASLHPALNLHLTPSSLFQLLPSYPVTVPSLISKD